MYGEPGDFDYDACEAADCWNTLATRRRTRVSAPGAYAGAASDWEASYHDDHAADEGLLAAVRRIARRDLAILGRWSNRRRAAEIAAGIIAACWNGDLPADPHGAPAELGR